ncbi:autotransporter outer membrane beta-barrel domain-containing protein [Pseudomonas sp. GM60]|uniref:autotransporter outer membrane beta-barrel domain-containing protein n=1 Tax=Pseudomonas sp. GM60 TaxID=1144334 RepID=UPI0002706E3B|nr:autotransporter outer membrane beta-barrel domain-containing protein [Pseudomonas sp. GM60]EJM80711.1 outer membrane autotransporter barrel domain-containing protein [Pseudomonas sp. GM60]
MPVQHKYRPRHLAFSIALAVGCAEFAAAQQTSTDQTSAPFETSEDLIMELDAFIGAADTQPLLINKIAEWRNLQLDERNDLVSVLSGGGMTKRLDGDGGINVIRLDHTKGGTLGETRDFAGLDIKQGTWTLNGGKDSGDFQIGALVRPQATLTNNGHIEGRAVAQGTLVNNGSIGGNVEVYESGTFSGKGRVGGLDVSGGLVVNRQLGAPVVAGDMKLSRTAVLTYEVNADGRGETIKVDGTASLGDATLKIAATGDFPQTSQYTLIEATNVVGRFGDIENNLVFMTPELNYDDPRIVSLTYARNDVSFESIADTESGKQFGASIEEPTATQTEQKTSSTTNAAVTALLGSDRATAAHALEILAGDSNANLAKATLNSDGPISATLLSAMRQLDSNSVSNNQNGAPRLAAGSDANGRVWLQALGHSGKLDRDDDPLQHSTHGLVIGADWQIDEQWRLGLMGGQSRTRQKSRELDGNLDSWHLGAYALRQNGPMSLRLGATYNNHDGSSTRRVEFYGFKDRPKGRYEANTQQAFAEVGFNLGRASVIIEPFASLGYQRYQRDSFTEKGGDASLKVHDQSEENFSSTFGLRLAKLNTLDNGMQLTPRFSAGWKHTYGKVYTETRQRLVTGGNDYSVYSAPQDRDKLMVDAGVDLRLSARNTIGVGLSGEMGSDSRTHGVMGQWRMAF